MKYVIGLSLVLAACTASPPTAPDAEVGVPPQGDMTGGTHRITMAGLTGAGRYTVRGTARLAIAGEAAVLTLSDDFRASGVPDPVIYVGSAADPNFGTPLRIGRFAREGAQEFAFRLPPGITARYVIFWCDQFNVPVGYGEFQ